MAEFGRSKTFRITKQPSPTFVNKPIHKVVMLGQHNANIGYMQDAADSGGKIYLILVSVI
jgi:hypothetical protein